MGREAAFDEADLAVLVFGDVGQADLAADALGDEHVLAVSRDVAADLGRRAVAGLRVGLLQDGIGGALAGVASGDDARLGGRRELVVDDEDVVGCPRVGGGVEEDERRLVIRDGDEDELAIAVFAGLPAERGGRAHARSSSASRCMPHAS